MMTFCCRSYSLNDGISTSALREYARVMALLLWPKIHLRIPGWFGIASAVFARSAHA